MKVDLLRVSQFGEATFGVLLIDGPPFCVTLEPRWRDNRQNISCIPAGSYRCSRITSPHFGRTYEVLHVPKRSHILFHVGNFPKDTDGCIIVGRSFGDNCIWQSRITFQIFMERLEEFEEFDFQIKCN